MLFNRDSAISQCFCLHWHLDSELCIRNSWAGHKRRAMGGKEAGIHHECLPCAECQAFSDIWPSLILITCKERVDDTRSTDGQFPASQSVQLVQSKVDWKQKKKGLVTSMTQSALIVYGTVSRGAWLSAGMSAHETPPWLSVLGR